VDSIQTGIIVVDVETRTIVDVNPAASKIIGDSKEQIIGQVCHKYICPAEKGECPILDLGQKVDNSERTLIRVNGEEVPILKSVTPILLNGKESLIESFLELTEKKNLEAQLQQSQKMEAIGTLAGGIAHDFNNILTPIIVRTEMALAQIPEEINGRHQLKHVLKAGIRAKELVQQILTFSRQSEEERKPLELSPIVKEALKLLRSSLPATIEIRLNIETESDEVLASPVKVHQVLMNLCTNAAHAMRDKGGVLELSLHDIYADAEGQYPELRPGAYMRLTVKDTGHGMDRSVMQQIFDPFFTTKERGEGTGMGLSVVHGIVKGYDGSITCDSEPGKGTTFQVFIPRIAKEVFAETEMAKPLPGGGEQILLLDDEEAMVDAIKEMLASLGYKVDARTDPIEVLDLFREEPHKFDLVITDMTMPKMTGGELAKELIRIRPDIPIVLCTGFSGLISEEKAKAIGIREFVMKPIVMKEMAGIIRRVLDENEGDE